MHIIDSRRIATLKARLGEARKLIDSDSFLPMFRNRQKNYPEEFAFSVKMAKEKKKPSRFFATIWSKKNLTKTLKWIRTKIDRLKAKLEDTRRERDRQVEMARLTKEMNLDGLARLDALKRKMLPALRT